MFRQIEDQLDTWRTSPGRKPLILKGARQVGKTYLLKDWGSRSFAAVHYVNFEKNPEAVKIFDRDLDVRRILREIEFFLKVSIDAERDLLILDEIQTAPKALTSLKYFCEDLPQLAVCTAGSLLGVILSEESFPVGKVSFFYLHPFSFREFLIAVDDRQSHKWLPEPSLDAQVPQIVHEHLWEMLKLYYVVGGMPESVLTFKRLYSNLATAFAKVREIQRDLLGTYEDDFAKHAGKLKSIHIQALYRNIPSQLTSVHDDSVQRFKFGNVLPGKKGFSAWERPLHWLINAGIAIQVKIANSAKLPLEHYSKANIFKLYMNDVGLLGCASHLDPETLWQQDYGLAKGYFAENFVIQEMRAAHSQYLWPLYSWSEGNAEIEVVRPYRGTVIPIEVKAGHRTQAKSLNQFRKLYHPPLAIKISANPLNYHAETGLLQLPLYLAYWSARL
jgi:predicted AAA+ superfamily ATPase